jgi:formate/nitrite transporter FocA (FNT family)
MEVKYQTSTNFKTHIKKALGLRPLLNIVGVFIFLGLILTIVTVPYGMNENLEFTQMEKLKMEPKEIKEFLLFISGAALIYFFLANIYFIGTLGRKVFFITLIVLAIIDIYFFVRLI